MIEPRTSGLRRGPASPFTRTTARTSNSMSPTRLRCAAMRSLIRSLDVDKDDLVPTDNPFVGRNDAVPEMRSACAILGDAPLTWGSPALLWRRPAELLRGDQHLREGRQLRLAQDGSGQVLRLRQA